ncbi:hypothetical protein HNY73_018284 [Argiope bruennichi]|uniref:Gustatory receptor n=1 Tax=Argiope bruennichi TaxID=94029 RepID=A0A8T0EFR3_ARGBR|nr:hypothetical protein HNY73_018284 [Argiope bruennichi]
MQRVSHKKIIHYQKRYKVILHMFGCSLISGFFGNGEKTTICEKLYLVLSHVITIFYIICLLLAMFYTDDKSSVVIGSHIMSAFTITHRCFLCHYASHLSLVAKWLSKLNVKEEKYFNKQTYLLLRLSVSFLLICLAAAITMNFYSAQSIMHDKELLKYKSTFVVSSILVTIYYILFFGMPVNTFVVYFVTVSRDIASLFQKFKIRMISTPNPDYEHLINEFTHLRNFVLKVDSQTSCLVFWTALANVFNLYFAINGLLGSDNEIFWPNIICLSLVIIYSTFMFFIMCLWADRMSCSAAAISRKVHLLQGNSCSSGAHIRCLIALSQDVHFTVWGFFPLRKNFVLASVGAMITYSVMFKDIVKKTPLMHHVTVKAYLLQGNLFNASSVIVKAYFLQENSFNSSSVTVKAYLLQGNSFNASSVTVKAYFLQENSFNSSSVTVKAYLLQGNSFNASSVTVKFYFLQENSFNASSITRKAYLLQGNSFIASSVTVKVYLLQETSCIYKVHIRYLLELNSSELRYLLFVGSIH